MIYMESFNCLEPGRREYFQIQQQKSGIFFSATHESIYMRMELGDIYPSIFGKSNDIEYWIHVKSLDDIPEPIIKVTASRWDGVEAIKHEFAMWESEFSMAVAGKEWLDFTLADKGTGLDEITARMGIDNRDVMSFGDNFNDLPLLQKVGHPYIMENGAAALKSRFPNHCVRVADTLHAFLSELDAKK